VYPIRRIVGRGHAETGPRALLQRFRNAFDNAPIGIGLADLDWRFVEVNRALCQLLGYSEE
jgi:PAS domain S-box-containing protein